jgi:hypothetical protein
VPDALDPAPLYLVTATCLVDSGDGPQPALDYDIVEFDVTDGTVTPPDTPPVTPAALLHQEHQRGAVLGGLSSSTVGWSFAAVANTWTPAPSA